MKKCGCNQGCSCISEIQDLQSQIDNISINSIIVREERPVLLGFANINGDGTVAFACGNFTIVTNGTGRKTIVPPAGTISAHTTVVEGWTTRDSITSRLEDFQGLSVHTTEGDNGGTANVPRNNPFTISWYGKEEVITDIIAASPGIIKKVNSSEYAETSLNPVNIHIPGGGAAVATQPMSFTGQIIEGNWTTSSNTFTYTGTPKKVFVDFNIRTTDEGASNYWANPMLRVTENVSGRVFWGRQLAMQDNTIYDGTIVFSGSFTHLNPPVNPNYTFEWYTEENRTATLIPDSDSRIVLEAVNEFQTLTLN